MVTNRQKKWWGRWRNASVALLFLGGYMVSSLGALMVSGVAAAQTVEEPAVVTTETQAQPTSPTAEPEPAAPIQPSEPQALVQTEQPTQLDAVLQQTGLLPQPIPGQPELPALPGPVQSESPAPQLPAENQPEPTQQPEQPPHKSYVCKYVGTPGVDERFQTGENPIWVDNHSLLGHDGTTEVGQQFSDGQGKSVVIVANTPKLDPEPGLDSCPAPEGPPETVMPPAPTQNDVCGTENDMFTIPDVRGVTYWLGEEALVPGTYHTGGELLVHITATATENSNYEDGEWTLTFTNEPCAVSVVVTQPSITPVCGPNNDTVTLPVQAHVGYTQTGWVNDQNTVTATVDEGYFVAGTNGLRTMQWVFTDSNTPCAQVLAANTSTPGGRGAVLAALTVAPPVRTAVLQDTGQNPVIASILAVATIAAALAVAFSVQIGKFLRRSMRRFVSAWDAPFTVVLASV